MESENFQFGWKGYQFTKLSHLKWKYYNISEESFEWALSVKGFQTSQGNQLTVITTLEELKLYNYNKQSTWGGNDSLACLNLL